MAAGWPTVSNPTGDMVDLFETHAKVTSRMWLPPGERDYNDSRIFYRVIQILFL